MLVTDIVVKADDSGAALRKMAIKPAGGDGAIAAEGGGAFFLPSLLSLCSGE